MQFDIHAIRRFTHGAARVEQTEDGCRFHRFHEAEEALYQNDPVLQAPAGVRLLFRTNSRRLILGGFTERASPVRSFYGIDILVDGVLRCSIGNYDAAIADTVYAEGEFPFGPFRQELALGPGEKLVEICLPYSVGCVLQELSLDDGATAEAVTVHRTLLAYGDSITHGFDALHPSARYVARVCRALGADEYNKGIGGAIYDPRLAALRQPWVPDIITIAYGTNDFRTVSPSQFRENCRLFLTHIAAHYPTSRIYVISPLCRLDCTENENFGKFSTVGEIIAQETAQFPHAVFIDGLPCIPGEAKYFGDGCLHPNDAGFAWYGEALYQKIKEDFE